MTFSGKIWIMIILSQKKWGFHPLFRRYIFPKTTGKGGIKLPLLPNYDFDLGRTYYKINVTEKINTINNKIEKNKAQYNLDRQTVEISIFSTRNVCKYEFLIVEDVLPEKRLLEQTTDWHWKRSM